MIPRDDRGFLLGDGLFETVLVEAGRAVAFERHLARMAVGCAALDLPAPSPVEVRAALDNAVASAGLSASRAAVRVSWSAGSGGRGLDRPEPSAPRLIVTAAPSRLSAGAVRLALSSVHRNEQSPTSRHKTLAYLDNVLARREARAIGADEAIMLNTRGDLACCAAANLFWMKDEALFTPSLACGVLPGLVREDTLAAAAAHELTVHQIAARPSVLDGADAVFVTNSLIGLRLSIARSPTARDRIAALAATVSRRRQVAS